MKSFIFLIFCAFADLFRNDPDVKVASDLKKQILLSHPELVDRGSGKSEEGIYLQFQLQKPIAVAAAHEKMTSLIQILNKKDDLKKSVDLSIIFIDIEGNEYYQIRYYENSTKLHRL